MIHDESFNGVLVSSREYKVLRAQGKQILGMKINVYIYILADWDV